MAGRTVLRCDHADSVLQTAFRTNDAAFVSFQLDIFYYGGMYPQRLSQPDFLLRVLGGCQEDITKIAEFAKRGAFRATNTFVYVGGSAT